TGTLAIPGGVFQVSGATLTGGTWEVAGGATLNIQSAGNLTANEAVVILDGPGPVFTNLSALTTNASSLSVLSGTQFTTAGTLTNRGTLTVGPASNLMVTGKFTQTAAGTLSVQIGGTPASGQFGQVAVAGQAALDGTLALALVNGFGPTTGQTYQLLTFA